MPPSIARRARASHYSHVGADEKREAVARVFAIVRADERVVSGVVDSSSPTDPSTTETQKPRVAAGFSGDATQI